MFGDQFYPTPDHVIEKMIEPYIKKKDDGGYGRYKVLAEGSIVMDPSAGSGAILDWVKNNLDGRCQMYACEIDAELKSMLLGKDYRVVEEDFLEYNGSLLVDYIFMNPPFRNGAEHLLHAWKVLDRGHICCLLNEQTIKNPNSQTRQVLANLIEAYGSVEFLGNCFSDADRKTDVNVAMVRLYKKAERTILDFDIDFESERKFAFNEKSMENEIQLKDTVGNMIVNFDESRRAFLEFMEAAKKLKFYLQPLTNEYFDPIKFASEKVGEIKYSNNREIFNSYVQDVQSLMWRKVLNEMDVRKYLTNAVLKNFEKYLDQQGSMAFSKENIWKVVQMLFDNRHNIMHECIVSSFEYLTSHTVENRMEVEGWKTNTKYKINKKVILPYMVKWGDSYDSASYLKEYGGRFSVNNYTKFEDLERALAYLSGKDFNKIVKVSDVLGQRFRIIGNIRTGEEFDSSPLLSEYFHIKFWKKGTVHATFLDERLWNEFNMMACLKKNWLPDKEARDYTERKKREAGYQEPVKESEPLHLEYSLDEQFIESFQL